MAERIDDAVDALPTDPTSTINEVSYQPTTNFGVKRSTSLTNQPTLEKPQGNQTKKEPRSTFQGTIVNLGDKTKVPRQYKVLRQDLKLGFAYCYGMEAGYYDFRIGDEVALIATDIQGVWSIIGGAKKLPLPTAVYRVTGLGPSEEVDIKWNTTILETAFDETFTLDNGEIKIKCDGEVQLNLFFQATVTLSQRTARTKISVVTDVRLGDNNLEVQITEIYALETTREPFWAIKIPLTTCGSY